MRKLRLLILLSLASFQCAVFVAAQGPKHPDTMRRGRESARTEKPGRWNRERTEDLRRAPTAREEHPGDGARTRDKVSAWDRRQDRTREAQPFDGKGSHGRVTDRDKLSGSRRTAEKTSKWDQRGQKNLESKPTERPQLLEHVFRGQLKKGEARGFHYEGRGIEATYGTKVIEGTRTALDAHGVYEARVTVRGVEKRSVSSFFPRSWSRADVVKTINEAYISRASVAGRSPNYFEGRSSSGVKVGLYCNRNGAVVTAFPLYGQ